jgi:hypothetical protein
MRQGASAVREVDLSRSLKAFRNLPVGVAIWQLRDLKDVRSLRFVGSNPAAERELCAPVKFAVGKPITECFPKLLETHVPESCRRAILTGMPDTLGEVAYRDTHIPAGIFWMDCFPLPERCVGLTLENITKRKHLIDNQHRALQLLHRVTLFLNDAPSALDAAQFCVDEICTRVGWPVGRFFLCDQANASRFLPNPVWHFSDRSRFRAFRRATELFERDLSNKLALEYRVFQGQKAGLARSIGFSVIGNDCLRGVLEFSSENLAPVDHQLFRAISDVGYQLGQAFNPDRLAPGPRRVAPVPSPCDLQDHGAFRRAAAKSRLSALRASLDIGVTVNLARQNAIAAASQDLLGAASKMQGHLAELKHLTAPRPILSTSPRLETH